MRRGNKFVLLDKDVHQRESFDCGKPELNDFLHTKASRHAKQNISRTWVLPSANTLANGKHYVCAYYTLSPVSIERKIVGEEEARKLPYYPIPCMLIGQMGVQTKLHGQQLGSATLVDSLKRIVKISEESAVHSVLVDCLTDGIDEFYKKYGFQELCEHNGRMRLYIPLREVQFSLR